MSRWAGWRPALRIARRDVLRSKGRNALVVAMVGLPVFLVSTFATVYTTNALTAVESLPQQMGATQALVRPEQRTAVEQPPDGSNYLPLDDSSSSGAASAGADRPWDATEVRRLLGRPLLDVTSTSGTLRTSTGRISTKVVAADVGSADLKGYVLLRRGRLPHADSEVVVSPWLATHGFAVGRDVEVVDHAAGTSGKQATARVVGVVAVPSVYDDAVLVARPGSPVAGVPDGDVEHTYLVPGPRPVTWQDVRRLNAAGLLVVSRSVVEHPPAHWQRDLTHPERFTDTGAGYGNDGDRAVMVLVVFSIVLEVVLLAGPAFAVGVRRQRRHLALVAASGGTARDVRRVVLAQGLATGALAAAVGAALGVPAAWLVTAVLPRLRPQTVLGPFDVAGIPVLVAAVLGAAAAVTAAYFPARAAARQDVVAVLAGRRGQVGSRRGLPVLGVVLLAAGAAAALLKGTKQGGEYVVAGGTLVMVLGAIALMPALVGGVGRLGRRLPLPLRLATRDSARQRGRTAPAVAAVMAAVAGVTTLAIGASSDFAQRRRDYQPRLPAGVTTVQASDVDGTWWQSAGQTVQQLAPGRTLLPTGQLGRSAPSSTTELAVYVAPHGCPRTPPELTTDGDLRCQQWQLAGVPDAPPSFSTSVSLVADPPALEALGYRLDARQRAVLQHGGVLLPSPALVDGTGHTDLLTYQLDYSGSQPAASGVRSHRMPAGYLPPLRHGDLPDVVDAVVAPATAATLGTGWSQTGGVLSTTAAPLPRATQDRIQEVLLGTAQQVEVYTERGFDESFTLPLLGLTLVAALAVLVGTLTATGLALVDGRPDAATLAAVGARPRTRRTMAAAQAVVIGLLGSLAGIAVGVVPGIAVTWPLTAQHDDQVTGTQVWGSPIISVPWLLLLGIGLGVPVVAALAAGLGTRSRLPLVRRLGQ